jgi:hypothetical protein
VASHPGQIPAGGRDKISVVVHTNGRGGQKLSKRFRVYTDDPKEPNVELVVTGNVEGFVQIEPPRLSFIGKAGDTLRQEVRITPNPKYPFTIKEAKAATDQNLRLELKPLGKKASKEGYLLTVTVIKTNPGAFSEYIQLYTDLKDKPTIGISVHGRLMTPPAESDGKTP